MPLYLYQNPKTKEYIEIIQTMSEEHSFVDPQGLKWDRIFTSPEISSQKITDPWDKNSFINETKNMKGTIGDMMDKSTELSNMRAKENGGIDPLKTQKFKDYSKERGGLKDPLDPSRKKVVENKHIRVDL